MASSGSCYLISFGSRSIFDFVHDLLNMKSLDSMGFHPCFKLTLCGTRRKLARTIALSSAASRMALMGDIRVERLTVADVERARVLFATMAAVFEIDSEPLSDSYLVRVLVREEFWALAASVDGRTVGGLTAHTLPLTRAEVSEVFIYDIAVISDYQRQGIGRQLVAILRAEATACGITVVFVPADNEDAHALDFYQALGGVATPVTIFTFSDDVG
jgi:aminoglycoside 3-N-acetyltransferase I